ncbi:Glucose-repressible alcohol dehydrogenase transcriptional effector [Blastocladiella emersonii ATCC 22665]|nr:Glucose-repressible alcohol dehydrogenase transcriptional effector [Blastocladiella emersonii ATCC 22665]
MFSGNDGPDKDAWPLYAGAAAAGAKGSLGALNGQPPPPPPQQQQQQQQPLHLGLGQNQHAAAAMSMAMNPPAFPNLFQLSQQQQGGGGAQQPGGGSQGQQSLGGLGLNPANGPAGLAGSGPGGAGSAMYASAASNGLAGLSMGAHMHHAHGHAHAGAGAAHPRALPHTHGHPHAAAAAHAHSLSSHHAHSLHSQQQQQQSQQQQSQQHGGSGGGMPPPIVPMPPPPLATPVSTIHQASISQQQVSRQSAQPHLRARTAAALSRSNNGNALLANQFDPNAPQAASQRPGTANNNTNSNSSTSDEVEDGAAGSKSTGTTSSWTTLDLGGMSLRNLSPAIFHYSFLTMLYLNHNYLVALPPAIEQLRSLVLLDVSGNRLAAVPPEIGMLVNLQCLYMFDNQLNTLPWELGNLYQLESLGIEGNPIQDNILAIIQKEGTQALVSYLRDHAPVGNQPPEREWIVLETQAPAGPSETCSVFCYNILSEKYATQKMYGYTPSWALDWSYRSDAILQEILLYSADIVCLQEVEMQQYDNFFTTQLKELGGYESVFWPKTRARTMSDWERKSVDGCATFFRASKYSLVDQQVIEFNQMALQKPDFKKTEDVYNRLMTKDNVAVLALLQNVETGSHILVANCHIHWDPVFCDVKLVQVAMLMEQLEAVCSKYSKELAALDSVGSNGAARSAQPPQLPVLICGDFNSLPTSGVYELLRTGRVAKDHADFKSFNYGNYTKEGLSHRMSLKSSYADSKVTFTNMVPNFVGVIDYIWYTNNTLSVIGLLGGVDKNYCKKVVGFPNAHFPSDHIPLLAEFRVCK